MTLREADMDYGTLLDAQVLAFIARMQALFPADAAALPMPEQRALYNRMCRAFHAGPAAGVCTNDANVATQHGSLPVRRYRHDAVPDGCPTLLYFHGGGFSFGDLDSHGDICAELCARTRYHVVSVGYRLAPEHPHPAAFDDAVAAFDWLARTQEDPIILAGESAGGNLAAGLALSLRRHARAPAGLVLVYPLLGGDPTRGSYLRHAHAPLLSTQDVMDCLAMLTGGRDGSGDPRCTPLAATDYAGLPACFVATAECDPLSSDGATWCERIAAAGGIATHVEESGLVHGYLRARHTSARAMQAFQRIAEAVLSLGQHAGAQPVTT